VEWRNEEGCTAQNKDKGRIENGVIIGGKRRM
jgi:hypothetical protein